MFNAISYLVLAGLCASLLGDALTLLPRQRVMYAVGAFFLSHLLYTIWFASQLTLSFSAGRDENAGADLYWNDAGDGLAGR